MWRGRMGRGFAAVWGGRRFTPVGDPPYRIETRAGRRKYWRSSPPAIATGRSSAPCCSSQLNSRNRSRSVAHAHLVVGAIELEQDAGIGGAGDEARESEQPREMRGSLHTRCLSHASPRQSTILLTL